MRRPVMVDVPVHAHPRVVEQLHAVRADVVAGWAVLVPIVGAEVNGARRWLDFGMRFQPSEFLKPAFAIAVAWILSWRMRDPNLPVIALSAVALVVVAALLMMQPNLGDTILFGSQNTVT